MMILRLMMCGTGWTISHEFVTRPLRFMMKCISACPTAEWAAFGSSTLVQSCEQGSSGS